MVQKKFDNKITISREDNNRLLEALTAVDKLDDDRLTVLGNMISDTLNKAKPLDRAKLTYAIRLITSEMKGEIRDHPEKLELHGAAREALSSLTHKSNLFGKERVMAMLADD